mmetsp:Transcript_40474/g.102923  ORF Transcript_40474/g.102923 Transcript_40474/m.102923 type:complete len:240 (+) Transcript_40474:725-1444(+)
MIEAQRRVACVGKLRPILVHLQHHETDEAEKQSEGSPAQERNLSRMVMAIPNLVASMLAIVEDDMVPPLLLALHAEGFCYDPLALLWCLLGQHQIDVWGVAIVRERMLGKLGLAEEEKLQHGHRQPAQPARGRGEHLRGRLRDRVAPLDDHGHLTVRRSGNAGIVDVVDIVEHNEMVIQVDEFAAAKPTDGPVPERSGGTQQVEGDDAVVTTLELAQILHLPDQRLAVDVDPRGQSLGA